MWHCLITFLDFKSMRKFNWLFLIIEILSIFYQFKIISTLKNDNYLDPMWKSYIFTSWSEHVTNIILCS